MPGGGARAPHQISCAMFVPGPEAFLPERETRGRVRVRGGARFPRCKEWEANTVWLSPEPGLRPQGTWGWRAGTVPGSLGITRSPALLWNDSRVHKGQARFLGNPAIWGHIRTGAELRPEKLNSHLRPVFGCAFGDGDGPFLIGGVIVAEQWLGEQSSPCSPRPFLLPPPPPPIHNSRGKRATFPNTIASAGRLGQARAVALPVPEPVLETSCHLLEGREGAAWPRLAEDVRGRRGW